MKSFCLLAMLCLTTQAKPSRTLNLSDTDVGEIHTALGYSTILQFESRPTSTVLGDQDAYKVEYVGTSLTIKPVVAGAKTNLFTFTDYDRFSFRLVTGPGAQADYIVRVKRKGGSVPEATEATPSDTMATVAINRSSSCELFTLTVDSVAYPPGKPWLVINFTVASKPGKEIELKPENFSVTSHDKPVPIETLYLEALKASPDSPVIHGSALIKTGGHQGALATAFANYGPMRSHENHISKTKESKNPMKIDKYFLEEICPFTKVKKVRWKRVKRVAVGAVVVGIGLLLSLPSGEKAKPTADSRPSENRGGGQAATPPPATDPFSQHYSVASTKASRQYTASQLVKRGDGQYR